MEVVKKIASLFCSGRTPARLVFFLHCFSLKLWMDAMSDDELKHQKFARSAEFWEKSKNFNIWRLSQTD